jgi:hypothetical protein
MVTAKRKYKKSLTQYRKSVKKYRKHVKKHVKKHRKHSFTNRVQIGCSNKKNKALTGKYKVMMGGGVNALSQPFENAYYALTGGISNSFDNFLGNQPQPSSSMSEQPYLTTIQN